MKKKCAIIIDNAFSYAGTENICNYMSDCLSEEVDITILSLHGGGKPFYSFSKVKSIISFDTNKYPLLSACHNIIETDYQYVFVISMGKLSFLFSILEMFIPKLNRRNVIACEHVSINSFNFMIRKMKLWALKRFNKVIALTEDDYNSLISKGVNVKKISNPIYFKNFNKKSVSYHALAIGRLEYQKGYDILIDIWEEFYKSNPKWRLSIAGEGSEKNKLNDKINEKGLSSTIKLLGKVSNVDELYKESDVFLMTSRYEGLPLVLLEAKSWSLPIIAFDCPTGPKEVINDSVDGFLIAMNDNIRFVDKLNVLSRSHKTILEMSESTKKTHIKYSESKIRSEWRDLIIELE